ncbi:Na+/H+ antiporter subunit E [Ramlibacter rhizophilus]|uniref:Na+/H+ antiporter subunit E n=1 Tax=Ramlibacter rhizophilus TaxID=1781167 RepID=A0A4Z0BEE8_9BURK|nr:Na+/H+ antiporter subunit E [Ramlibacter rhizophilus]TFY96843.1 Na+/H+ antiporter subunit E [Ramlibacter rhizophilus]
MNSPHPESSRQRWGTHRWFAHPALSVLIAVVWLLLQGSLAPVHLLWAAIMGLVLPWAVDGFIGEGARPRAGGTALRLAGRVLWDIVKANLVVARIVLDPRSTPQPAWIRVPYVLEDARAVMLLATIITNTPGTVSCVVDEERREILVHALDAPDPQAIVDEIVQRYELPLREILG